MDAAQDIKRICVENGLWVATAESLTAGHLQSLIASVSGASNFFSGGITAYNIDQKVKHLGVDRAHAASVDCVSPQVAAEMARGATELFCVHIGVSTTGYAEPPAGSPTAFAYFAIWDARRAAVVREGRVALTSSERVTNQHEMARRVLSELQAYLSA